MFTHLLSPIRVGRLALPNRVLITAHATNYVDGDGLRDARAVHYYAERARGGAGLMVTGASSVHPSSPRVRGVVNAQDARVVPAWQAIADAVHAHGGHILVMLTHMGRVGRMPDMRPLVAPSPLMDGSFRQAVPHELDTREIAELVEAFARAARFGRALFETHALRTPVAEDRLARRSLYVPNPGHVRSEHRDKVSLLVEDDHHQPMGNRAPGTASCHVEHDEIVWRDANCVDGCRESVGLSNLASALGRRLR